MNYIKLYSRIITNACLREIEGTWIPTESYEVHHIQPRSQGGSDHQGNLIRLTPKEHYIAHLCLWKMGDPQQIFSVECFLTDAINPKRPHRFAKFRWKKWLRKAVAYQRATNIRATSKANLKKRYHRANEQIDAIYVSTLLEVAGIED